MLDSFDPQTPYILAASSHLDFIKLRYLQMSVEAAAARRQTCRGTEAEFAALRWLNEHRFGNSPSIAALLDAQQRAVTAASTLAINEPASRLREPLHCPACGTKTEKFPYERWRYCVPCVKELNEIHFELEGSDRGFGTWLI